MSGLESRPSQGDRPPVPAEQLEAAWEGWAGRVGSRYLTSVVLMVTTCFAFLLWASSTSAPTIVVAIIGGFVLVTLVRRTPVGVAAVVVLAIAVPALENFRMRFAYDDLASADWWGAGSIALLVGCLLQYLELGVTGFQRWRRSGSGAGRRLEPAAPMGIAPPSLESHGNGRVRVDVGAWLRGLTAVGLAGLMLWLWPLDAFRVGSEAPLVPVSPYRLRFDAPVFRVIVLAWMAVLIISVPATLIGILRWRRLSVAQAELHMRRNYGDVAEIEHRVLERAKLKYGGEE